MKIGDLVTKKGAPTKSLGMIIRLFSIDNRKMHKDPLPMVEVMTDNGIHTWKSRKVEVVSESR